jgi:hypothetical protein
MGSPDALPAGFEIRFGSLNFQATGNRYLMRITNRDELHPWRPTGPGPMPTTPATDAPAPAQAAAASTSTPQRCRRSGQRSREERMERRRAAHAATRGDMPTNGATAPTGEHAVVGPQFPGGMCNTMATYASSVSIDVAANEDLPGHHLLTVQNLIATTNDESYHGSAVSCRPQPHMGMPSGTSPACRTR